MRSGAYAGWHDPSIGRMGKQCGPSRNMFPVFGAMLHIH